MIRRLRQIYWHRKLQRLVAKQRASFECRDYARRRAAGKLGWQRKRGLTA